MDPAVRRLFRKTDMAAQRKNLMQTLTVVVKGIDRLDALVPAVQALGRRHAGYGVALSTTTPSGLRCSGPSSRAGRCLHRRRARCVGRGLRHAGRRDDCRRASTGRVEVEVAA
jgi:hypothetical protein